VSIWKKEEPPAPRPPAQPAVPQAVPVAPSAPVTESKKETPVSSTSFRPEETRSQNATIGKGVRIVGQIFTKEDLNVDGDVEGSIESTDNKIIVGAHGRVQAGIKAREVVILGSVQGNVEATDKVDIKKEAKLVGDIISARISIEDGALFKGSIDIRKPEVKTPSPASSPAPSPIPPASAAPSAAANQPGGMQAAGFRRP
jgi:cytoskeletal protein CcmA (bactofilin family)